MHCMFLACFRNMFVSSSFGTSKKDSARYFVNFGIRSLNVKTQNGWNSPYLCLLLLKPFQNCFLKLQQRFQSFLSSWYQWLFFILLITSATFPAAFLPLLSVSSASSTSLPNENVNYRPTISNASLVSLKILCCSTMTMTSKDRDVLLDKNTDTTKK